MNKAQARHILETEEGVRQFTAELRRETETEYRHMIGAAWMLYTALRPHHRGKAALVSSGLILSGLRARTAARYAVRTYAIFMKEHGELLGEARSSRKAGSAMAMAGSKNPVDGAMRLGGKD